MRDENGDVDLGRSAPESPGTRDAAPLEGARSVPGQSGEEVGPARRDAAAFGGIRKNLGKRAG